jgi:hypothetical protein
MFTDFILNGEGRGNFGQALDRMGEFPGSGVRYDTGLLRPYNLNGRCHYTINTGRTKYNKETGKDEPVLENWPATELIAMGLPVANATQLSKQSWTYLDQVLLRVQRQRLRAWADLAGANTFGGFDGMSKLSLEYEAISDPGDANVDFDGITEGRGDAPQYSLRQLPLPIIHSGFWYSERRLAVSRNTNTPLDDVSMEAATRRCMEVLEKTTIGTLAGITAPGSLLVPGVVPQIYGYTNFPQRVTYTSVTTPTGSNPNATLANVLAMRDLLYAQNFFGPYMLYHSADWDQFMDNDYVFILSSGAAAPSQTLRNRIREIEDVMDVRRLDYFTPALKYQLLLVQMTPEVCRAVVGMPFKVIRWDSLGGQQHHFKVMGINVPQLRYDYKGQCGICHGTTS